jgi:hypothetical protein
LDIVLSWWQNVQNVGQSAMNGDQKDLLEKKVEVVLALAQLALDVFKNFLI